MKCLVLRTCFRGGQLYKEGQVREVPDEIAQLRTKDFQPLSEAPQSVTDPLTCKICGKPCKSEFGLQSHMRIHK